MSNHESPAQTVIEQVKADYARFPQAQSYHLYAKDVYFKDPMNEFRGVTRYRQMIGFIEQWFQHIELELHDVDRIKTDRFTTHWTLRFTAPVPWRPRITIPGWSELQINDAGLICSHVDYWKCSRWQVVLQLFKS
ncbi:MAG: DUF2358 domain-containing protein [Cyanobacteria bacterium P01_B01_bin.77]